MSYVLLLAFTPQKGLDIVRKFMNISYPSGHFKHLFCVLKRTVSFKCHNIYFGWEMTKRFSIKPRHVISNSGILTSVGSDEPVQPSFKLRKSRVNCLINTWVFAG